MAKCEHCGFSHAIRDYCSNCGSSDPLPSRRLLRLAVIVLSLILLAVLASIPISLYLKRSAAMRDYPTAPPMQAPTPAR